VTAAATAADGQPRTVPVTGASGGVGQPRTVLVTGASGGVGEGIALACAAAGWRVWIAARRKEQGAAVADAVTAAGGRGEFVQCDVADPDAVERAFALVRDSGPLHGVVHNATSGLSSHPGTLQEVTQEQLADHVRVALRAFYLVARASHPLLAASAGAFVVTTSEAGFEGKKLLPAYSSVKAAQRGLVRVLSREWGPDGIRVNCIGPLATSPAIVSAFELEPAMEQRVLGRNPAGRLGDPVDDIGPVVRFLLGPDASYVAGQTIMVDGGSCQIT
jgi:3-oxoacyl-[acyl-carrier protein] reductase